MIKKKQPTTFWNGPKLKFKKTKITPKRKPKPLFKPVRLNDKKYVKTINTKHLTWAQAQIRYPKMKAFNDKDKDGILNGWDCKPFNNKKHGWKHSGHTFPRERSSHVVMMSPDKFIRTTLRQSTATIRKKNPEAIAQTQEDYEKEIVRDYDLTKKETVSRWEQGWKRKIKEKELKDILKHQEEKRQYMEKLKNVIRSRKGKMEVPFLEYDVDGRPTDHEGRHRAIAARELGVKKIPVTIAKRLKEARDWKDIRAGKVRGSGDKVYKGMAHKNKRKIGDMI